jgi:hypothetical protein
MQAYVNILETYMTALGESDYATIWLQASIVSQAGDMPPEAPATPPYRGLRFTHNSPRQ